MIQMECILIRSIDNIMCGKMHMMLPIIIMTQKKEGGEEYENTLSKHQRDTQKSYY